MSPLLIVGGIVLALVLWVVGLQNRLVTLRARIQEALSNIGVQLKRRTDLIPNLVETVKGYAKHEKEVFEKVTEARTSIMKAQESGDVGAQITADNQLTGALKTLFAVAEAYPQLMANQNFMQLQSELRDTEDKIAFSRQFYNSNVLDYNALIAMFPANLVANILGFRSEKFFEVADEDTKEVKVQF